MKKLLNILQNPALQKLGGEAFWVAMGIALSTIGTFVGVRLLTAVMTPEEYGRLALAVSMSLGLVYSVGVGGGEAIVRFFPIAQQDGQATWYWTVLRRSFVGVILASLVMAAGSVGVGAIFKIGSAQMVLWAVTMLFGGALTLHSMAVALHTGARNRKVVGAHQCLYEWGRFLLAFGLVLLFKPQASWVMLSFLLISSGVIYSECRCARKWIASPWSTEPSTVDRSKEFWHYFWPMAIGGAFFWLQMFADRWALKTFCSLEEVGVYFALYQISYSPMIYFSKFLSGFLGPILYGISGDGSNEAQTRQTLLMNERISIILLAIIALGFGVALWIGQPICTLLVDGGYAVGFWAFPWILLSGGIYAIAQQLLLSVYSGIDTRVMIPVRAVSALLSCTFYLSGAYFAGFVGVVFGGLGFSIMFFMISVCVHLAQRKGPKIVDSAASTGGTV